MKHRAALRYIQDGEERQAAFAKRKRSLMRKAMELAVMCNAQVALVVFDDKGRLTQFSSTEMDGLLEQYGKAVLQPHERYTPHDMLFGNTYANGFGIGPAGHAGPASAATHGVAAAATSPGDSPASSSEALQAALGAQQLLGPLGLAVDASTFPPLSPRSREAYATIAGQFDAMIQNRQRFETLQWQQMQAHAQRQRQQQRKARPRQQQLPPGLQQAPLTLGADGQHHDEAGAPAPDRVLPALPMLLQQPSSSSPVQQPSCMAAQAALAAALPRPGRPLTAAAAGKRVLQPAVARKPKLRVALPAALPGSGHSSAVASPPEVSATPDSHTAGADAADAQAQGAYDVADGVLPVNTSCDAAEAAAARAADLCASAVDVTIVPDALPEHSTVPAPGSAGAADATACRKRGRDSSVGGSEATD